VTIPNRKGGKNHDVDAIFVIVVLALGWATTATASAFRRIALQGDED
jgi:hypothetical protein